MIIFGGYRSYLGRGDVEGLGSLDEKGDKGKVSNWGDSGKDV